MVKKICTIFCKYVVFSLCIAGIKGQTQRVSHTSQAAAASEPGVDDIYQTDGFNSVDVKSGPILIIDKKTLFISDVNYNSRNNDANFWVGVGEPSSQGVLVPDENNSERPLKKYQGQNIYLQLPNNWTTDRIDYIAVWSENNKTDLGYVKLYQNSSYAARNSIPEAIGFHNKTRENKTIFRIPGCCGRNELRINGTCIKAEGKVPIDLKVFKSNATHIDPQDFEEEIEFVTYKYYLQCPSVGYDAFIVDNKDAPGLIYNSSLIYYFEGYDHGILPHGPFCISHNGTVQHIYICLKSVERQTASIQYLYFPFLVVSTLCFLGSAIIYIFILKAKDVHKKCFVGYSLSMVVTFLALICLQKVNGACNLTGGLFLFFIMCSFVWLACLCLDLIFIIKSQNYLEDQTRIYVYLALSFAIPTIILLFSLVPDGIPDVPDSFLKPYYGTNTCSFGEVKIEAFFIPVGLLITIPVIGLGYTSYIINTRNELADIDWIPRKKHFKFMLRSCFLIWMTTFIWLLEALVYLINFGTAVHLAIDFIEALQGVFVTMIFVLHKYSRKEINNALNEKKHYIEDQKNYNEYLSLSRTDVVENHANAQNT